MHGKLNWLLGLLYLGHLHSCDLLQDLWSFGFISFDLFMQQTETIWPIIKKGHIRIIPGSSPFIQLSLKLTSSLSLW